MLTRFSVWVHGTSARAEFDPLSTQIAGWGSNFEICRKTTIHIAGQTFTRTDGPNQGTTYFHFAPATQLHLGPPQPPRQPPDLPDPPVSAKPAFLGCLVLYNATGSAYLREAHIFDGGNNIATINNPGAMSGDHSTLSGTGDNAPAYFQADPALVINTALGISLQVTWYPAPAAIVFSALRADFEIDIQPTARFTLDRNLNSLS